VPEFAALGLPSGAVATLLAEAVPKAWGASGAARVGLRLSSAFAQKPIAPAAEGGDRCSVLWALGDWAFRSTTERARRRRYRLPAAKP